MLLFGLPSGEISASLPFNDSLVALDLSENENSFVETLETFALDLECNYCLETLYLDVQQCFDTTKASNYGDLAQTAHELQRILDRNAHAKSHVSLLFSWRSIMPCGPFNC